MLITNEIESRLQWLSHMSTLNHVTTMCKDFLWFHNRHERWIEVQTLMQCQEFNRRMYMREQDNKPEQIDCTPSKRKVAATQGNHFATVSTTSGSFVNAKGQAFRKMINIKPMVPVYTSTSRRPMLNAYRAE